MENIVDFLLNKKIKFIGLFSNWLYNLERIKEFDFQFLILLCLDIFTI